MVYETIKSGLSRFKYCGNKHVYHVVLTSPVLCDIDKLISSFRDFYRRSCGKFQSMFDYFVVFTDEGNGTIHLLIVDFPYSKNWISQCWSRVHGSLVVSKDMVCLSSFDIEAISVYLATQKNIIHVDMSYCWIGGN